jgi:hypothetical protein
MLPVEPANPGTGMPARDEVSPSPDRAADVTVTASEPI